MKTSNCAENGFHLSLCTHKRYWKLEGTKTCMKAPNFLMKSVAFYFVELLYCFCHLNKNSTVLVQNLNLKVAMSSILNYLNKIYGTHISWVIHIARWYNKPTLLGLTLLYCFKIHSKTIVAWFTLFNYNIFTKLHNIYVLYTVYELINIVFCIIKKKKKFHRVHTNLVESNKSRLLVFNLS